jgi:chitin disaccharide deacetylase
MLCADDYAMTAGISRSIEMLAGERKLSATSAMTTTRHWLGDAPRIREYRSTLSIGLHLNFTFGEPLVAMPKLAPQGTLPTLKTLMGLAFSGQLDVYSITEEIARQCDAFERALGVQPDHVDGHQHVQVLPVIRRALISELSRRYGKTAPLLRDPTDRRVTGIPQSKAAIKARIANGLAVGFGNSAKRLDLPVNDGFSGFSAFDTASSYRTSWPPNVAVLAAVISSCVIRASTTKNSRHLIPSLPGAIKSMRAS